MNWNEGHPEHWRQEMVRQGYNMPPEKHQFEHGNCIFCGHLDIGPNTPSENIDGICIE